ncbi:MAG TPA: STAS domain-containing protein [Actinomycetota bacterium]|jgi:anti-anti-sigma factor|nr:STAS domain-containing protein [Actinomycetota bacterium]
MSESPRQVKLRAVECEVSDEEDGVLVAISGEIDINVADELESWLLESCDGKEALTLDLSNVGFMDSTGLHMLIALKRGLEQSGRQLLVSSVSEPVEELLSVSGLTTFFDAFNP